MNAPQEYKEFLKSDIWRSSDVVHDKPAERNTFERVVISTFDHLDLSDLSNRRGLFVQAYDYMVAQGFEERDITLLLALFERSLNLLEVIETKRAELLEFLTEHRREEASAAPEDHDTKVIAQLDREIGLLTRGSLSAVLPLLEEYSSNELNAVRASKSSFAGPYVRSVLGSKTGNRRYTERFRGRLAQMLHTSPQAVAAMKAWNSGELNERGSNVAVLIDGMRPKVRKAVSGSGENGGGSDHVEPVTECPEWAYSFIGDSNLVSVARSLEPPTFELDDDKISREQRRWIYALFIFGPDSDAEKSWLRKALATEVFHCSPSKVSAVTAHLSGKLYNRAKESGSERWQDIEEIMRMGEFLNGEGQTEQGGGGNDPITPDESLPAQPKVGGEHFDYDNEVKIEWRKRLQSFIEETTDPERRKDMRVLCLPGKECLEIGIYTDLGFELCNIVAVEGGDREARAVFEENAKVLGVEYRVGRLEDGIVEKEAPFDVVSLDFLGAMCPAYVKALNSIPYSESIVLCINTMAKRDALGVAYGLLEEDVKEGSDAIDMQATMEDFVARLLQEGGAITPEKVGEVMMRTPHGSEVKREVASVFTLHKHRKPVAKTRELGLVEIYTSCFGNQQPLPYSEMADCLLPAIRFPEGSEGFDAIFGEIIQSKAQAYSRKFQISSAVEMLAAAFPDLGEDIREHVQSLVRRGLLNKPRVTSWGRYTYQSRMSPFVSHFMKLESPAGLVAQNQAVTDFLIRGAVSMAQNPVSTGKAFREKSRKLAVLKRVSNGGKLGGLDRKKATFIMRQLGISPRKGGSMQFRIGPCIMNITRHGIEAGIRNKSGEYVVARRDIERAINDTKAFDSADMLPALIEEIESEALSRTGTEKRRTGVKGKEGASDILRSVLEKATANDPGAILQFRKLMPIMLDRMLDDEIFTEIFSKLGGAGGWADIDKDAIMRIWVEKMFPGQEGEFYRDLFMRMFIAEKE